MLAAAGQLDDAVLAEVSGLDRRALRDGLREAVAGHIVVLESDRYRLRHALMREAVGPGVGCNFDPSHLVWIGIDPVADVRPYVDRIPHAQAKEVELFPEERNRYGTFGKAVVREDPWDVGWWRYRVPGLGQVDWVRLVDALYEGGFAGVLSVEHEDPVWGGTEELIEAGLEVAQRTLSPLIVR